MVSVLLTDQNLLFLHVPKTAGASVSRALLKEVDAIPYSVTDMSEVEPCAIQLGKQLPKRLAEFQTVSILRNPWDWAVSAYLHVTINFPAFVNPPSFKEFILGDWKRANILQYPKKFATPTAYVAYHSQVTQLEHLSIGGTRIKIDHLCMFESLEDDLNMAFGKPLDLLHINKSDRVHYSRYYDDETE